MSQVDFFSQQNLVHHINHNMLDNIIVDNGDDEVKKKELNNKQHNCNN